MQQGLFWLMRPPPRLCDSKASRVYRAEWPFHHGVLVGDGRLQVFPDTGAAFMAAFQTPCVVFADHPSLRFGAAAHFMEMWRGNPDNMVILTEPDISVEEVVAGKKDT